MTEKDRLFELLHHGLFGVTRAEHAALKGVALRDLDDSMSLDEMRFHTKAMVLATILHTQRKSYSFQAIADDVMDAARSVRNEMQEHEAMTGRAVVTAERPRKEMRT